METRAELKRQYKEMPNQPGVFLITNTANGKILLGSSANLYGLLNRHRFLLSSGLHWNKQLQQDWKQFGADCFNFEVVEVIEVKDDPAFNLEEELSLLEEVWLEKTQPFGERGYNKDSKIRE